MNLTISASVNPDFMRIVHSILFIKSCGSWSSGFPVKNTLAVSVISSSSQRDVGFLGDGVRGTGGVTRPISCGVQTAGDRPNWEAWTSL